MYVSLKYIYSSPYPTLYIECIYIAPLVLFSVLSIYIYTKLSCIEYPLLLLFCLFLACPTPVVLEETTYWISAGFIEEQKGENTIHLHLVANS